MGGMVGGEQKSHTKGKKVQWKKPRMSIRIDMTPMVDVAFLLLIFFMVTTVFRLPQAMEINLPPDTDNRSTVDVKQSRLLTFRVDNDNHLFFNVGNDVPQYMPWDSLDRKIKDRKAAKDASNIVIGQNLIVIGKIQPQAPFKSMVELLDVFTIDSVTRYSVAKWEAADDSIISLAATPAK